MPNLVTLPIPKTRINYFVAVSTTLVVPNASDAVQDSSRKLGSSPKRTTLSPANVRNPNILNFVIIFHCLFFLVLACNCFGHTDECQYNPDIDRLGLSLDINGFYEGGGVCQNCRHNTQGINCNECKPTFYRPYDKLLNATDVCQRKKKSNVIIFLYIITFVCLI